VRKLTCYKCGEKLVRDWHTHTTTVTIKGSRLPVLIPNCPVLKCCDCGIELWDEESDAAYMRAVDKAKKMASV
jgi:hypothetical protein